MEVELEREISLSLTIKRLTACSGSGIYFERVYCIQTTMNCSWRVLLFQRHEAFRAEVFKARLS